MFAGSGTTKRSFKTRPVPFRPRDRSATGALILHVPGPRTLCAHIVSAAQYEPNEPPSAIFLNIAARFGTRTHHPPLHTIEHYQPQFWHLTWLGTIMSTQAETKQSVSDDSAVSGDGGSWAEELESASRKDSRKQPWKSTFGAVAESQLGEGKDLVRVTKIEGSGSTNYSFQHFGGSVAA